MVVPVALSRRGHRRHLTLEGDVDPYRPAVDGHGAAAPILTTKYIRVASTLSYTGGEFTLTALKTSRARRSVDLPDFVVAFLRRHRKDQNERKLAYRDVWGEHDIVLDDGIGQPLSPWTVSAAFRRVVAELGLPRTRFHDLRHAHATQLLSAGVHVKAVSERLGHSSTSFTMDTYSSVIPSMGRTAAEAADHLFSSH